MTRHLVVDASVAAKWLFAEEGSAEARQLLLQSVSGELHLLAPDHFLAEVANIIWKKSTIRRQVEPDDAAGALHDLLRITPELVPSSDLLANALAIAHHHRRTVYDSLYVALAWRRQCDFVTADVALVRALNVPWVRPLTRASA